MFFKDMRKRTPLRYKIMLLTVAMVCFVLVLAGSLVARNVFSQVENTVSGRALDIARMVAQTPMVQESIEHPNASDVLQPFAERLRYATGAAFIVIANMDQIRLTHTIVENIGTPLSDLYRDPVLQGKEYIYVGKGSLAPSLRANVPVFSGDGTRQVGFISVGFYLTEVYGMALENLRHMLFALLVALSLSILGALLLARNIQNSIFGLEPHEIATILKERVATLEAIREGMIAVDRSGAIRVVNSEASAILGVDSQAVCGRNVSEVLPTGRIAEVVSTARPIFDEELRVNEITILANTVPIIVDGMLTGAVITFRDRTEVCRLAEELTGVNRLVDVLRTQAHEYKNKLHVISGLIQLGRTDEAVDYITGCDAENRDMYEHLRHSLKDPVTFALLVGKSARARELGINLIITPDTQLTKLPGHLSSGDMVLVLGNLIENAMDAVAAAADKIISVGIHECPDGVFIRVQNTGLHIDDEIGEKIFQRGVTTKAGNRGLGLALVKQKANANGGWVRYRNIIDDGVEFEVYIPAADSRE